MVERVPTARRFHGGPVNSVAFLTTSSLLNPMEFVITAQPRRVFERTRP
jgi:hypothetical protein